MLEKIVSKLFSGKFILTVIAGFVFAYSVVAKILPPEATASILSMIFVSYFNRKGKDETKS